MPKAKEYDAIVVGSGASGGWVAKVLCEQGIDVLMLEAGPPRLPERDFTEHIWPYRMRIAASEIRSRCSGNSPYSAFAMRATSIATTSS